MDSEEDLRKLVREDVSEVIILTNQLQGQAKEIANHVNNIKTRIHNGEFNSNQGNSFLEVKNHLLLSYITNLSYIIHQKMTGRKIEGDEAIDRLAEIRTVLEKMRPIDQKMKYQIDKMIRTATTGDLGQDDPLRFKANPENMSNKIDDGSDDGEEDDNEAPRTSKSKSYVPPKLSAVYYDGDETQADRHKKVMDKARKRVLSSSIMQELRREYDDGPEEIRENSDMTRLKADNKRHQKTEYEEEYMTRLPITKQEKHKSRQIMTVSSLGELAHFEDISALDDGGGDFMAQKKRKKGTKKSKKKGGFRKRGWK